MSAQCQVTDCGGRLHAKGYCAAHYAKIARRQGRKRPTTEQRFWPRVDTSAGPNGCWPWLGYRRDDGYGRFSFDGRMRPAHRYAYLLLIGPIPDGLVIDHLCRNTSCVNPRHLEPVTDAVNIARGTSWAAVHGSKTHCINGHEFTAANTYRRPTGGRLCRACAKDRREKYRAEKGPDTRPRVACRECSGWTKAAGGVCRSCTKERAA